MNPFKATTNYLNDLFLSLPCFRGACAFGIAEMVEKDGRIHPVINENGLGVDIIPDNRYPIQFFWMLDSGSRIRRNDEGYGENEQFMSGTLRLVVVGVISSVNKICGGVQEDVEYAVINSLPNTSFTVSQGVYGANLNDVEVSSGKAETLNKYFSGFEYKSRILDLLAFEIKMNIEGTVCLSCGE